MVGMSSDPTVCLRYFLISVMKYLDQENLKRKCSVGFTVLEG